MILVFSILAVILSVLLYRNVKAKEYIVSFWDWAKLIVCCFLMAGAFFGAIFGIFKPFGGYETPDLIESHEVVSFVLDCEEIYAVDNSDECTVFIKVKSITSEGEISASEIKHLEAPYEIIPEENCKMPRVEKYIERGKGSIWSLNKENDVESYKVYVPVGTVFVDN